MEEKMWFCLDLDFHFEPKDGFRKTIQTQPNRNLSSASLSSTHFWFAYDMHSNTIVDNCWLCYIGYCSLTDFSKSLDAILHQMKMLTSIITKQVSYRFRGNNEAIAYHALDTHNIFICQELAYLYIPMGLYKQAVMPISISLAPVRAIKVSNRVHFFVW